jgi:hypothetical protein
LLLPVHAQQGARTACFQSTLWTSSNVSVAARSYWVLLWCAAGGCSPVVLLAGKQWLSPACLEQDKPVLVMCFYCFMIEEVISLSGTAAVACGESSSVGRCNSSKASLAEIQVSQMLYLGSETSFKSTEMYIFGLFRISSWSSFK